MTSGYLMQPLRSEAEVRLERAAREVAKKFPVTCRQALEGDYGAKRCIELSVHGRLAWLEAHGEAGYSEIYGENECTKCDHPAKSGKLLCADCQSDLEAWQERRREEATDYRGPRYWRSL